MIQPTLTQNGIALMVKAFCGAEIQFTKLKIGSGSSRDIDIKTLTDLINPIKNINISRMDRNDNNIILVGAGYDNSEVENDIIWNEVGVYATDPDEGEILFAYVNTEDALEIIKSNQSGVSIENNLSVMLLISSDINVSAVITSIQYASKQELLDHINESNPHKTTKEDIGLGKVENLAISEQQPEFETGVSLTNISEGDTIKTIVSKLWSTINSYANHISSSNTNPHNIYVRTIFNLDQITSSVIYNIYNSCCFVQNKTAYIMFTAQLKREMTQSSEYSIINLPLAMRPKNTINVIGVSNNKEIFTVEIGTSGYVKIYSFGSLSIPAGSHIRFQAIYPV